MPCFYHRAAWARGSRQNQRLQPIQCRAVGARRLGPPYAATGRSIEHPRGQFNTMASSRCRRRRRAPKYLRAAPVGRFMDYDPQTEPRMPGIQYLPLLGLMGILEFSCTIKPGRTGHWLRTVQSIVAWRLLARSRQRRPLAVCITSTRGHNIRYRQRAEALIAFQFAAASQISYPVAQNLGSSGAVEYKEASCVGTFNV